MEPTNIFIQPLIWPTMLIILVEICESELFISNSVKNMNKKYHYEIFFTKDELVFMSEKPALIYIDILM